MHFIIHLCKIYIFALQILLQCWLLVTPMSSVVRYSRISDVPLLAVHVSLQIHLLLLFVKALRRELKEKEYSVLNAIDQARVFLAEQPIEAPEEPRRNLQSKTGEIWDWFLQCIIKTCARRTNSQNQVGNFPRVFQGLIFKNFLTVFQDLTFKCFLLEIIIESDII